MTNSFVVYSVEVVENINGTRHSSYQHFFMDIEDFDYFNSMTFHVTTVDNYSLASMIANELDKDNDDIVDAVHSLVDMDLSTENIIFLYGRNKYLQDVLSRYNFEVVIAGNTYNERLRQARG